MKLNREDFLYQPYYCEENIWHLCQNPVFENSYVIFIVSAGDSFPMRHRRVTEHPSIPVLWDYHVILLAEAEQNHIIDFDTTLPFCTDVKTYFTQSFIDNALLDDEEIPMFRIIAASDYVDRFSSDRSHMKSKSGWQATPPDWPVIGNKPNNFADFIDSSNNTIGEILSYREVMARFSSI